MGITTESGQGLTSPSTAAAARLRERRGGPGGPAGLLQGPARPSYTSCRWGALKGFARARCATDENIFLEEEPAVRGKAKGAVRPAKVTGTLGPRPGPSFSRLRVLEEVKAASSKEEADLTYSQSIVPQGLRTPLPALAARKDGPHSLPKMANTPTLLGKAAAHRGRMSSEPLDVCPSCVISVTYTASYCRRAVPIGGEERRCRSVTAFS